MLGVDVHTRAMGGVGAGVGVPCVVWFPDPSCMGGARKERRGRREERSAWEPNYAVGHTPIFLQLYSATGLEE